MSSSRAAPPATASAAHAAVLAVRDEIAKVVVGQDDVVTGLLAALVVRGHVMLEGVPGVAKTLVAKALAAATDLGFRRVQLTPDLMPSDITGQLVLDDTGRGFEFRPGPVFTNLLLADEVNRTPPRTQAALLEAMEERQVTAAGVGHPLPDPFTVVATRNPVEYEGTYPLPEAQLDRFLFELRVDYPSVEDEDEVVARHDAGLDPHDLSAHGVSAVAGVGDLRAARREVRDVRVTDDVRRYLVEVARATRAAPSVTLGVSPRGAAMLLHAAKAWTWLDGKQFVTPDDVKEVTRPALRHRLTLRPDAELDGVTPDGVLDAVLTSVPVPR